MNSVARQISSIGASQQQLQGAGLSRRVAGQEARLQAESTHSKAEAAAASSKHGAKKGPEPAANGNTAGHKAERKDDDAMQD